MATALHAALEPFARKLKKRIRKAARGDPEAIHDARTTVRRIREGLVLMGRTAFEPSRVERLERGLHRVERSMAATRDDDVLAADLEAWLKHASRRSRDEMAAFQALLLRRRRRDMRRLSRTLTARQTKTRVRKARRFLCGRVRAATPPPRGAAKAAPSLVRHFMPDEAWRAYEEVLAYETRLPAGVEVIHKVRSSCRRLRYALEIFAGALPSATEDFVEELSSLQDTLGELHDHAVAVGRIDAWLMRGKFPLTGALEAYRAHHVAERDRLRAGFEPAWRALSGDRFRFALSRLVSGEIRASRPDGAIRLTA